MHEGDALDEINKKLNVIVQPCGLFIDEGLQYLAATPEGLSDNDGIMEIKCPSSCSNLTSGEGFKNRKFTFLVFHTCQLTLFPLPK